MGIKIFWAIALQLALFLGLSAQNKDYQYYTVKEGETVEGIAKSQKIDRAAIDKLNPEVRYGLKAGMILLLPKASEESTADRTKSEQKQKESSEAPASPDVLDGPENQVKKPQGTSSSAATKPRHIVVAGDTWYSLSKKWGCTVEQAQAANPGVDVLKIGSEINIPSPGAGDHHVQPRPSNEDVSRDSKLGVSISKNGEPQRVNTTEPQVHTVLAGETLYSLSKRYQTTVEQLKLWNGGLADGLKVGQEIKVGSAPVAEEIPVFSVPQAPVEIARRAPGDPLRVALILPFSQKSADSTAALKTRQQEQKVAAFYAGVLMAVDSLRKSELKVELRVYDDADRKSKLDTLLEDAFIRDAHFVLGPLYGYSASSFAKAHKGWVISPMSLQLEDEKQKNLIDLMPGEEERLRSLAEWIRWSGQSARLILVSESEKEDIDRRNKLAMSLKLQNFDCDTFHYASKTGISASLAAKLSGPEVPIVVALSKNRGLIEALAAKIGVLEVPGARLVCLNELDQINLYDKQKLVKAKLSIVRSIDLDRDHPQYKGFVRTYKSRFRNDPDVFSFQGHDSFWMACNALSDGTPEGGELLEGFQIGWKLAAQSGGGFANIHAHMVGLKDWEWERIY